MIIIKEDRRCIRDVEKVFIQLINDLVKNNILIPNETFILFDGLYFNGSNDFLKDYYNKFKDRYNNVIKKICNNIHIDFECKSLIGLKFNETIRYYNSIDFWIAPQSSAMELLNQTNNNGLIITPENLKYCTEQQCCYIQNRTRHEITIALISNSLDGQDLIVVNQEDLYNKSRNIISIAKLKFKINNF